MLCGPLRREQSPDAASSDDASPWPTATVVWKPGAAFRPRSRYAAQVILPLTGSLRVRLKPGTVWRRRGAIFAAPRTSFEIDSGGAPLVIGFVRPDSDVTAVPEPGNDSEVAAIPDEVVQRWRCALVETDAVDANRLDAWARSQLVSATNQRSIHPGVLHVIGYLRRHGLVRSATSLACLAQVAQMSPSRLMHVFTESLGIPLASLSRVVARSACIRGASRGPYGHRGRAHCWFCRCAAPDAHRPPNRGRDSTPADCPATTQDGGTFPLTVTVSMVSENSNSRARRRVSLACAMPHRAHATRRSRQV